MPVTMTMVIVIKTADKTDSKYSQQQKSITL